MPVVAGRLVNKIFGIFAGQDSDAKNKIDAFLKILPPVKFF